MTDINTHAFISCLINTLWKNDLQNVEKSKRVYTFLFFIFIPFHEFVYILLVMYYQFLRMVPKIINLERLFELFYRIFSTYIYKLILFIISHLLSNQTLSKYPLVLHVRLSSIKKFHHMIQTCILNKFQINIPRESRISSLPPLSLS